MKPLHISLLVIGAALAGGLAVRMTQPPAMPVSPAAPAPPAALTSPPPPLQAPEAIAATPSKPSPIPKPASPAARQTITEAPAPVYAEPPKAAPRPAKPLLIAKASPSRTQPTQWTPAPYEPPSAPAPSKPEAPATVPTPALVPEPHVAASPASRQVVLRTGMTVVVRLDESLSSDRATPGDNFQASLAEPLVVDDLVIAERGARATGRIVDSQKGARLGSPSTLELALTSVTTSDGQRVALPSDPWTRQADRSDDPIGAIFSRPKPATVPTATIIRFRLSSKVTVTEQIAAR